MIRLKGLPVCTKCGPVEEVDAEFGDPVVYLRCKCGEDEIELPDVFRVVAWSGLNSELKGAK